MNNDNELKFKVLLCGNSGVGKTSIYKRLETGNFENNTTPTVGPSFLSIKKTVSNQNIELVIWDTAGQDQYRTILPVFFRNAKYVILVYDISSQNSFNSLTEWVNLIKERTDPNTFISIIGNKVDLESKREVLTQEGFNFHERIHSKHFFEVSALTGDGINDSIQLISEDLLGISPDNIENLNLNNNNINNMKKNSCC